MASSPHSTRCDVLQAAGRFRPLSEALRQKIIPGVTLDEVKAQTKTYLPMVLRGR